MIGTVLLSAMLITACSDDDKDVKEPDDPDTEDPGKEPEPEPEPGETDYLWLVEEMKSTDGFIVTFKYNDDHTLSSIEEYSTERDDLRTVTFTWSDGNLERLRIQDQPEQYFVYGDNIITVETEKDDNDYAPDPYYLILENGKLAYISIPQEDQLETGNEYELRQLLGYDALGRLSSMHLNVSFINGEQVDDPWDDGPTTYEYDDKNAIAYSGMLPDWYFASPFFPINTIPPRLTPLNNINTVTSPGMWGGVDEYGYEYNEEGYPTEIYSLDIAGEKNEDSAMTIKYKLVEIKK